MTEENISNKDGESVVLNVGVHNGVTSAVVKTSDDREIGVATTEKDKWSLESRINDLLDRLQIK